MSLLPVILPSIFSTIGSVVSGIFNVKGKQGDIVLKAFDQVGSVAGGASNELAAIASIVKAEASSTNLLASSWRPIMMLVFAGIIVSFWFGYVPPDINKPMSPMMQEIFEIVKIGMGGYIGGRTIEKVMAGINVAKLAQTYLDKKVL
jgi:hypothetical protein